MAMWYCDMHLPAFYDQPSNPKPQPLQRCDCGSPVSLLKPNRTTRASPWQCLRCGTIMLATVERKGGAEFHGGVRPAHFRQIYSRLPLQSLVLPCRLSNEDIRQLRNCAECAELRAHDLRTSTRYAISAPLTAISLNEKFAVTGEPAVAYSIDISTRGLAILYPAPTTAPLYAIDFLDSSLNVPPVILRPIRCSRLGSGYAIAGEFVCRVDY
ncbi:hypothetical protein I41_24860 [Lacipirellula limnantheis]|uniref:PilZ domain-containing protein n=1 Tax=Lacipirellula limnantheis TaxID=2528024 RepID=A0A517TY48_9BACT|nr:hypothetical protein I41_24860 [Lacipirellula limnantheis]